MMPEKSPGGYYTVRVRFCKVGALRFISHLDLIRTLSKIIVRARLPLWYTEGFNPKPKISYAAPLSIGTDSLCEFMDLRLTEYLPEEEIREALNQNLTDEMQVDRVYYPTTKINTLAWVKYDIRIHTNNADEEMAKEAQKLLSSPSLVIRKNGKAGEHDVDIAPWIHEMRADLFEGDLRLFCTLRCGQEAFLNPEHLIAYLKEKIGILGDPDLTAEWYTILRTEALDADFQPFV